MGFTDGLEHIVRENEPLAPYTWFRLGGAAEYFAEPTSIDELSQLVSRCKGEGVPVKLLGGGSNVLINDDGVEGLVIHLSAPAFCEITVNGQIITAGGGAKLNHLVSTAVREGLAGLEDLVGIPGTVGGALHGNAGSRGGDIGQWTDSATVMTRSGEVFTRGRDELHFAYRQSSLDELVILGGQFRLEKEDTQELTRRMQKLWIVKKSNQPSGAESSGCVFKDAGGASADSMIEQAGMKGAQIGGASVSDRDAAFVVADRGATSQDVRQLIESIQTQVQDRLGVELETEIAIW